MSEDENSIEPSSQAPAQETVQKSVQEAVQKIIDLPRNAGSQFKKRGMSKIGSTRGDHFWISAYPFFSTTLYITSSPDRPDPIETNLQIYDCDGALVNEIQLAYPQGETGIVELEQFLEACKLESGMKHAHLIARGSEGVAHYCQLNARDQGAMLGQTTSIYPTQPGFFPVTFAEDRSNFIAAVNYGSEQATLRVRLFSGTRTPEATFLIPGHGARVFGVEYAFADCMLRTDEKQAQAYVRFTTKSDPGLGIQLLERTSGVKENSLYHTVS